MSSRDFHNNLLVKAGINPSRVTDNTAQVSGIIDRQDYRSVVIAIAIGTVADADTTIAFSMEHGDDSALADTAVPASTDLLGTPTGAGFQFDSDNQVRKIGYIGSKRYIRFTLTPSANSGNLDVSALVLLFNARGLPVVQGTS